MYKYTLGVDGGYTQRDVTELARVLAGITAKGWDVRFNPRQADRGTAVVLDRPWRLRPRDGEEIAMAALDDLAARPQTARHLARKLAVHFVADDPPPALVDRLERTWRRTDGTLRAVAAALVDGPEVWEAPFAKARQPRDWLVAALRALRAEDDDFGRLGRYDGRRMIEALEVMGQPPDAPPAPDGWEEEPEAWITPAGLARRIETAKALAAAAPRTDPRTLAEAALGPALTEDTARAVAFAPTREEGIAILFASPAFNRR